ncbi:toxin-antitoxin system YwqK family antitoxin [Mucilaginibacter litoreus]|uniref:Toxin-antitoxin system YwqK family antitoxin n=1 Tax=Mucilaginibacter litoreus TaxID=1048221 RepID=A0ABW3APB8_9SPHI
MPNRYLVIFLYLFIPLYGFSQQTLKVTKKVSDDVKEVYHVLASDGRTKTGLYQAFYKNKTVVANGGYSNGKRTGVWQFYNRNGKVVQSYNFDRNQLYYEAPEDTTSSLHYAVDKQLDSASVVTKPVKIGGVYFGYLPYVSLFKIPGQLSELNRDAMTAVVELLISPGGRLADYKVHLYYTVLAQNVAEIPMNLKLPDPNDLTFTPATLNGVPITSRVLIRCKVKSNGRLDFN